VAGWKPRYTSRETFEITMRAQGKLPPGGPAPDTTAGRATADGASAEEPSEVA
jgi:hypothetical protein